MVPARGTSGGGTITPSIPAFAGSVDELVSGATERVVVDPGDARSGSVFERLVIDGRPYFLKSLSPASDWIMRITGDHVHRTHRIWMGGIMQGSPPEIDHAVVGMALVGTGDEAVLSILMHDVGEHLVPEGDDLLAPDVHADFMDGLAALSARWWGWEDDLGLTPLAHRFRFFAPATIAPELVREDVPGTLRVAEEGWARLPERSPALARLAAAVHERAEVVADALRTTPCCFLQGDWKAGNLGHHADGRTILLDWAYPGSGPVCWDLAWYLALNRARLPESKEATAARLRDALEARGVTTDGWWERQLELSLLGMAACFAWEKALGDDDELGWWVEAAERGARRVDGLVD